MMKNQFKKICSLILIMAMLLSVFSVTAGAVEEIPMTISVSSSSGAVGQEVEVFINVKNNPGINSMSLSVSFESELTLKSVEYNASFGGTTVEPKKLSSPVTLAWANPLENCNENGTFAKLRFMINKNVQGNSETSIKLDFDPENIYNVEEKNIPTVVENGTVKIYPNIPGDVNADGKQNNKDFTRLFQWLSGWNVVINQAVADVNNDGKISNKDATRLFQWLSDWDVEIFLDGQGYKKCQHSLEGIAAKAATCNQKGNIAYWHCTKCGKYFSDKNGIAEITLDGTVIEAKGHSLEAHATKQPTTTSEGNIAYWYCTECKKYFSDSKGTKEIAKKDTVIPPLKVDEYTITYNIAGNDNYLKKLEIDNPNKTKYTANDEFNLEPITTVEGYNWVGWFNAAGAQVTKIQKGTTGNMTLWAKFEKELYTITFNSPIVPYNDTNTLTRYISDTTPLRGLKWDGYVFVGWSDDSGKIIKEIEPGTANIKIYANWMSERNKAWAKKDIGDPIIIESEETNSLLFIYEIGRIENVPLQVIENFGYVNSEGVTKTISKEYSVKTDATMMEQYTQTVANSTTNTAQWSLSSDWTDSVTVNENYLKENNLSETDAKILCTTDSENWLVSSGSSGATTTTTYDSAQEYDLHTATNNTKTYDTHDESSSKTYKQSAELKLGGKIKGIVEISGKLGYEGSGTYSSADKTGTEEDEGNQDQTGSIKHTGTDSVGNSGWNNSSSYGGSRTASNTDSVSKTVAERIASEYGYGKTYIKQGGETSSQGTANSSTNSNAYSSSVTYCKEESTKETITYTTSNTKTGYHRLIKAGTAHVFAMVGYDIKTASYFVNTYTVMDDESHDFEDYSYSTSKYDDNQISVIPFEIPYDVEEYVLSKIGESEGLEFSKSGKVTGYNGTETTVIIPEYHVFDNQDGTKSVVKVTSISPNAFKNNKSITGIQLSDYISEIPANAFEGCTSLSVINMPNVTSIGAEAFKGCNGLDRVFLSQNIESVGNNAFENIHTFAVYTDKKNVIEGAINSGAKNIVIYADNSNGKLNNFKLKVSSKTEIFFFNGRGNIFENLTIDSDANITVMNNATINSDVGIPLKASSSEVQLGQVNIKSSGIAMIFANENCVLELYGESSIASTMGNSMLCKNLEVLKTAEATKNGVFTELEVNGDILVCGNIINKQLINYSGHIIDISEKEYRKYSNGVYTLSYDANGGTMDEISKTVYYGESYGVLSTPTRDHYNFDGWYTKASGGNRVTESTIFDSGSDITIYAHWTQKPLSGWVLASNVPSGAMIKDTKWTYDLTTTTTSSNSSLAGYTLYNTTWRWSDYGAWSGWQRDAVSGSDSRQVNTRYIEPTYKTQYNYNRWINNSKSNWGPCAGTWSGVYCGNYEERGWSDESLPCTSDPIWSGQLGGYFRMYGYNKDLWYNETTRQVQTGGGYTEYQYRDRYQIYTYYFKKVESKESSTEVRTSDSISNVNKWVRYIEK